mgnify:FL=1
MFARILWASALLALPIVSWAQTHPCMNLLTQSAQAGVAAKICNKQVNMEAITQLHQQNQCAAFFAQDAVKSQLNTIASQASHQAALQAKQIGSQNYCRQAATDLGSMLK